VFPGVFTMSPTYSLCFWKAIQLCNWLKVETEDIVHVYSPASYIYRYPSFMVWITGPRITSMSQILWEERMRNCLNIWIPRRIWTQSGRMLDLLPAVNWEVELQGKEPHMVGRVITSWCRSYSKAQRKASSQMLLKDHCNRPAGSTQTFRIASIYASHSFEPRK